MRIKVALVEPSGSTDGCFTFAGHNEFEPLGLGYRLAEARTAGHDVQIFRQEGMQLPRRAFSA